jgi:23S rRNA (uracil1939-C5)-methyltransferase
MSAEEVEIVRLGARGDGIAETAAGPRYLPFALPGERVRAEAGGLPRLQSPPSPERREPGCRHFGVCGGCVAQHMSTPLYADWKRGILVEALRQRGLSPEVGPLRPIPAASRRRAVLTARRAEGAVILGYHPRESEGVFDLQECPVLVPEIVAALPALREIAAGAGREVRLTVLATPAGLDVAVAAEPRLDAKGAARLAQIAAGERRLARLALNGEILSQRELPRLSFGGVDVCPPPGAFVQAVAEAEALLAEEVGRATHQARRVADLFCGVGTIGAR